MAGRRAMAAVLVALPMMMWSMVAQGQGLAAEVQRFDARLQADAAVLSPAEQGRLARAADRLEMRPDQGEAMSELRGLDQGLSFAWTELPGSYRTLAGPWPATPTLTLPDLYAPDGGGASIPTVWTPAAMGDWPRIDR